MVVGQETLASALSVAPDGCPGRLRVQVEPFQFSACVWVPECWVAAPTAMHRLAEAQDTPTRSATVAPIRLGVLCAVPFVPFPPSASMPR